MGWARRAGSSEQALTTAGRAGVPHLDSLTGLRWLAALVVFLDHLQVYAPDNGFGRALEQLLGQGLVGVSFFFILSGFVLTWTYRDTDRPFAFYRRRFARIAPAYWVALLVVTAGRAATPPVGGPGPVVVNAMPSFLGVQTWFPVEAVYFGGNSVGWSVSDELFFYAMFPLLIPLLQHRTARTLLVVVGVLALVLTPLVLQPDGSATVAKWAVYVLPVQRIGEFVLGMALAWAISAGRRVALPVPAALALAAAACVAAGFTPFWAQVALVTVVPFVLLIGAAATADLEGRTGVLGRPAMRRLGEWSYSFYLVHLFVITSLFFVLRGLLSPETAFALGAPLALGLSLAAAATLYLLVERPLEKRLRHARPRPEMLAD